ncbi:MAG: transferrin-binding protein-like solute binding protein [Thermodesulfobacteriota bacterium]
MKSAVSAIITAVALLLATAVPPVALAAPPEPVATVVALRGTVVARNAKGAERSLAMKSPIFQEDVLKTGSTGRLQLMFTDNSIISLGGGSEMKIAEYRWQPEQKDGALRTQIKEGTFRVMGGALTKDAPQNFKTETPTATIGIRGSMYAGAVTPTTLSVVFQGGRGIEITNPFGTVAITKPGFGTHVTLNAPPLPPVKFTEKELGELNKQLNGNGKKDDKGATPGEDKGGAKGEGQPPAEQQAATNGEAAPPPPAGETAPPPGPTTTAPPTPSPLPEPEPLPVPPPPLPLPPPPIPVPPVPPLPDDYKEITFPTPPSPPSDGIYAFSGGIGGTSTKTDGTTETFSDSLFFGVNWHNHKVFGIAYDETDTKSKPVFFFGTVSGSTISDLTIFGSDEGGTYPYNDAAFIRGSGSGLFSGTAFDFFSFTATGSSYLIKGTPTQTLLDSWTVAGGGQQVAGDLTPAAPKGTAIWTGFVVGVSEDMNNQPNDRHFIYNTNPNSFTMSIDKDSGTILGTLTTDTHVGGTYDISGMTIGGSYGSAYLMDNALAAILGCSGSCVGASSLKTYGNYMVASGPDEQFSTYFTWGYWEAAYVDPDDSTTQRQFRVPESLWLAGKPSTNSVINTSFVGSYSGKAYGTMVADTPTTTDIRQVKGTVDLTANFTSTPSITGNIALTDANNTTTTLNISGGAFTSDASGNKFSATLTGGGINGAFYGPNAEAVGGNFSSVTGGYRYLGIFGGNKVP